MTDESYIHKYERFFRDPNVGERLLQPPHSGTACQNIRIGIKLLDYKLHARHDRYDEQLAAIVEQFQSDHYHTSVDGKVGPGTRQLLTRVLLQERGVVAFSHMEDPEEQLKIKAQEPIQKDIQHKKELIEAYKDHLHILKLQKAKFGISAPPHVQIGIDEMTEMIDTLEADIDDLHQQL